MAERTWIARAGIAALNLIAPGLGLARLGRWRGALTFLGLPNLFMVLVTAGAGLLPITGYRHAIVALVSLVAGAAALVLVPAVLSRRHSRFRMPARRWSRWYGLAAVAVADMVVMQAALAAIHGFYKPFYIPAESMSPTVRTGDKLLADMHWRGPLRRGDVVLFRAADEVRISRVAALPGDRIAMRAGVPTINGVAAARRILGPMPYRVEGDTMTGTLVLEKLPGEGTAHRILDLGTVATDDMAYTIVPPGHLFMLGDNRDRSADSRVPPDMLGVGMVPVAALIGRPLYLHWSASRDRIGIRLDR